MKSRWGLSTRQSTSCYRYDDVWDSESTITTSSSSFSTLTSSDELQPRRARQTTSTVKSTRRFKKKPPKKTIKILKFGERQRLDGFDWEPFGLPAVHLGSIQFKGANNRVLNLSQKLTIITNPGGDCAPDECPSNIIDNSPYTRWCDAACAPLIICFEAPVHISAFLLSTAFCDPSKDPVLWDCYTSEVQNPGEDDWIKCHSQKALSTIDLARSMATEWLPLSLPENMAVRTFKFCVGKVRGSKYSWQQALREQSLRRHREAVSDSSPRSKSVPSESNSPPPVNPQYSSGENYQSTYSPYTFSPCINDKSPTTPRTRQRHIEEWCSKGAEKIKTRRQPAKPTPKKTKQAEMSRINELYCDASQRKDRLSRLKEKEQFQPPPKKIWKPTGEPDVYERGQDHICHKQGFVRKIVEQEASLRGPSYVENDPWVRLYKLKKTHVSQEPSARDVDNDRNCTFHPMILQGNHVSSFNRESHVSSVSVRSKSVPMTPSIRRTGVPQFKKSTSPVLFEEIATAQVVTAELLREGLSMLDLRLGAVEMRVNSVNYRKSHSRSHSQSPRSCVSATSSPGRAFSRARKYTPSPIKPLRDDMSLHSNDDNRTEIDFPSPGASPIQMIPNS